MSDLTTEFYRLDPLTGCYNFLSFVETLNQFASKEVQQPFSILYLDMNHMGFLNDTRGHSYGDSVLRWLGIVLQEEGNSSTYRIGGDDFALILSNGIESEFEKLLNRVFARLNKEGEQLGIPVPPATIALIHFDKAHDFSINDAIFHLGEAIRDVKLNKQRTISIFQARDLIKSTAQANKQNPDTIQQSWEVLQSIANQSIDRVLGMGRALDAAQKNSFLDSISGLPNIRAAFFKLDKVLADAATFNQTFCIMLIDGDDFRRYNTISYAAGDEMIRSTGSVLSKHLRPGDFIARWRTGDEFIVILPNTRGEGAKIVGERFCSAIQDASLHWAFPSTVTIGIAGYPRNGRDANTLVDAVEKALRRGKEAGKNRLVFAE